MQEIVVENIPQQSFNVSLGDSQWTLSFRTANNASADCTLADIKKDGTDIATGILCIPNMPLIPYEYMQKGNFVFISSDDAYPNYTNFGVTNQLYYVPKEELEG